MSADDRFERLLFPSSEEEWQDAKDETDAAPREPGRYKVTVGGEPHSFGPVTMTCPDCGAICESGGGVSFGVHTCPIHGGDHIECFAIHHHWGEDCPAWKHRWWRLWNRGPIWSLRRRRLSRKWRRAAKREREDPAAWADYWRDGGS